MAPLVGGKRAARQRTGRDDAVNCKKHPKHRQAPGVCVVCLSERLAQLAAKKEKKGFRSVFLMFGRKGPRDEEKYDDSLSSSPSSVSSTYSSSSGSSCSSPMQDNRYVISREAKGSSSSSSRPSNLFMNGKSVLTKSRSLAFAPRNDNISGRGDHGNRPTRFWSKSTFCNSSGHSKKVDHIQGNLVHSKIGFWIGYGVNELIPDGLE